MAHIEVVVDICDHDPIVKVWIGLARDDEVQEGGGALPDRIDQGGVALILHVIGQPGIKKAFILCQAFKDI